MHMEDKTAPTFKRALLATIFLLVGFQQFPTNQQPSAGQQLVKRIADQYLSSLEGGIDQVSPLEVDRKPRKKRRKVWEVSLPYLKEYISVKILLEHIFNKSRVVDSLAAAPTCMLNKYAWRDLKLFYGTPSAPNHHLLQRLDRCTTLVGRSALAILLATPTTVLETLSKRQQVVQCLCQDTTAFGRLEELYKAYLPTEGRLLSLWSTYDPLFSPFYEEFIQDVLYFGGHRAPSLNKSVGSLETRKRLYFDGVLGLHAASLGFQSYYIWKVLSDRNTFKMITAAHNPLWVRVLAWYPLATIPIELLNAKEHYDRWATPLRYLSLRMADVQEWLVSVQNLLKTVAESPALQEHYGPYLARTRDLFDQDTTTVLSQLVGRLLQTPFKNWSVFFNNNGKLLQVYRLFLAHRDALADVMYEFGQLDAFLSIARLLKEDGSLPGKNGYTFTRFIPIVPGQTKPVLSFIDFWHPFLDKEKAVPNAVRMDAGGTRTIILTGPNAGGKSLFLAGAALSALLSQTLTIVPAQAATLTPFHSINTYLDISADIADGKSFFTAGVERAQQQLATIAALKPNEFSFTVMDEIFSGTDPREGEAAAYSIVHHLAKYVNNLSIISTHFPKLALLQERAPGEGFANYKVVVDFTKEGKVVYLYKVVPGKSDQTIALSILEEKGYDPALVAEARDVLTHPEKYKADF
jgi:DNA mismatch repair protein MutS